MSSLLHFVSRMVEAPQTMFGVHSGGGSLVFGIAESLLSIFTFRKNHQDFLNTNDLPGTYRAQYPLANQSLLLILILTNHYTAKNNNNQYRLSLFGCCDSKGNFHFTFSRLNAIQDHSMDLFFFSQTDSPKEGATFKIDFGTLFETMCKIVTIDQATLLLYLLLHRNPKFYRFAMAHENLQQLVIPILQTLYNAPDSTSHHIYMTLIVLLILSEDDGFNKSVHQIVSVDFFHSATHSFFNFVSIIQFQFQLFADSTKYPLVHGTFHFGNITGWPFNISCYPNHSI